ncbi:hypothetical protein LXL04_006858 [Taraxacum kok-saghyz]
MVVFQWTKYRKQEIFNNIRAYSFVWFSSTNNKINMSRARSMKNAVLNAFFICMLVCTFNSKTRHCEYSDFVQSRCRIRNRKKSYVHMTKSVIDPSENHEFKFRLFLANLSLYTGSNEILMIIQLEEYCNYVVVRMEECKHLVEQHKRFPTQQTVMIYVDAKGTK